MQLINTILRRTKLKADGYWHCAELVIWDWHCDAHPSAIPLPKMDWITFLWERCGYAMARVLTFGAFAVVDHLRVLAYRRGSSCCLTARTRSHGFAGCVG